MKKWRGVAVPLSIKKAYDLRLNRNRLISMMMILKGALNEVIVSSIYRSLLMVWNLTVINQNRLATGPIVNQ